MWVDIANYASNSILKKKAVFVAEKMCIDDRHDEGRALLWADPNPFKYFFSDWAQESLGTLAIQWFVRILSL